MATASLSPMPVAAQPRSLLRRAWRFNWPLTLTTLINLALIPLILAAMLIDPKVITGVNGWIKPFKFTLSIAVYTGTFLWLLTLVQGRRRAVQIAANVTALALLAEIVLIIMQVVRGTTSHFNYATPFDGAVFSAMGVLIMMVAVANLLLGILLVFQRMPDPVLAWSVRLGVLLSFVGMAVAFLMTNGPTPEQLAARQAGEPRTLIGAHSVGVEDSGPGLPLLGWSTEGGDLRIGHFVGLHAMQVLPLLGFVLTRRWAVRRWNLRRRTHLMSIAGTSYLALIALVTWQALRGQSIVAPDRLTLVVAEAGAAFTVALIAVTLWRQPAVERAAL